MATEHHFTLMGRKWPLRFTKLRGQAVGWAYLPDTKNPNLKRKILIDERLKRRPLLETIIHECLQAIFPQVSEETITEAARDLARVLWILGYRQQDL